MLKKLFLALFFIFFLFITPKDILAAGEFTSSYDVTYDVDASSVTTVTEKISLKNLTERFYASSFSLTISATDIFDVFASDSQGALVTETKKEGTKTQITVKFNQQVVGKDKIYPWTLSFKSKDFAQSQGQVWQVTVPKISTLEDVEGYNLTLAVPVSFGDPTTILPEPISQSEFGGKLQLKYSKSSLSEVGILANFGSTQQFKFKLEYDLNNPSLLSAKARLPLPPNTPYQEIQIDSISPKPENVYLDSDGNQIALFNLRRNESYKVYVEGLAKLYISPQSREVKLTDAVFKDLTSSSKYWESDNLVIKNKLNEIFKDKNPATNREKARLINQFVVNSLSYNDSRLIFEDFKRFVVVTALNNPTDALCGEFTDLFIAITRAAGIPTKQLIGYAYTANQKLRPLSFNQSVLHTWPEYFDPLQGWVMIDPTWQNTTGGVDYFSKFDLNHLVLAIRGTSSDNPVAADVVNVEFSNQTFNPEPKLVIALDVPAEIYAGFPAKGKIIVENQGNGSHPEVSISLQASKLELGRLDSSFINYLPPFGRFEQEFSLNSGLLWQSYEDILQLLISSSKIEDQGFSLTKKITVKPFFAFKFFPVVVIIVLGLMLLIYTGVLILHHKQAARGAKK